MYRVEVALKRVILLFEKFSEDESFIANIEFQWTVSDKPYQSVSLKKATKLVCSVEKTRKSVSAG